MSSPKPSASFNIPRTSTTDSTTSSSSRVNFLSSSPSARQHTLDAEQIAALRENYAQYGVSPTLPDIPMRPSPSPGPRNTSGVTTPPVLASGSSRYFQTPSSTASPNPRPADSSSSSALIDDDEVVAAAAAGEISGFSIEDISDEQKAKIIRQHLVSKQEQEQIKSRKWEGEDGGGDTALDTDADDDDNGKGTPVRRQDTNPFPIPYDMPGADTSHNLYKWAARTALQTSSRPRSASFSHTSRRPSDASQAGAAVEDPRLDIRNIREPGGFRRNFVYTQRVASGRVAEPEEGRKFTKSFVDFLSLYGGFAGEDLEEEDEEEDDLGGADDLEQQRGIPGPSPSNGKPAGASGVTERSPLLRRGKSSKSVSGGEAGHGAGGAGGRKRSHSTTKTGDATVTQAILMLLKSFVGTGVLFLGKAFFNGGILFSSIVLVFIAMISLYSFLLLVKTRLIVPSSFGDIGGILYGPWMRFAILFSIVISQIGFVAAYTIFVAENLQAFVLAVTACKTFLSVQVFIFAQLVIFLPLAMFRNIQKLSGTALIADVFILIGLVYIFGNEIKVIAERGVAKVALFNPTNFPLLIGTAVFSFEGIGLVIPITEAMKDPHKFPGVLTGVMFGITIVFGGAGALAYAAYGKDIQTVVIVNLPQEDRFVNVVQFLYSMAIVLSTPLQLFPAVRIMENGLFSRSGKYSQKVKWEKNTFRFLVVMGCSLIAWAGAADLDKFVSLIGSVACVPLCFCYPALLHYRACAVTPRQKAADIALFVFGLLAAIYTSVQTLTLLFSGQSGGSPQFGKCKPPV